MFARSDNTVDTLGTSTMLPVEEGVMTVVQHTPAVERIHTAGNTDHIHSQVQSIFHRANGLCRHAVHRHAIPHRDALHHREIHHHRGAGQSLERLLQLQQLIISVSSLSLFNCRRTCYHKQRACVPCMPYYQDASRLDELLPCNHRSALQFPLDEQ